MVIDKALAIRFGSGVGPPGVRPTRPVAVTLRRWLWLGALSLASLLINCSVNGGQPQDRGTVVTEEPVPSDLELGRYRALLIGINEYRSWPSLRFAESDVTELRNLLESDYGFRADDVTTLLGSDATESRILNTLHGFLRDSVEKDNLLIYYSGHGNLDPLTENGYWIPYDAKLADESTWVPFTSVRTLLMTSNLQAQSVVLITDSCYGGSLTRSGPTPGWSTPEDGDAYLQGLRRLIGKKSRQVIASGGFETVPDKSDFAAALKDALRTNAFPLVDLEYLFFYKIYPAMRHAGGPSPLMERITTGVELEGQYILRRASEGSGPTDTEGLFWDSIRDSDDPSLYHEYLIRWPDGSHAAAARRRVEELGTTDKSVEVVFWESIRGGDNPDLFQEYLNRWPDGVFATIARAELARLNTPSVSLVKTPLVLGKTLSEAEELLSKANLELGPVDRVENGRPSGTVLRQQPQANEEVAPGSKVALTVSAGGLVVPLVVGKSQRSASRILSAASFEAKPLRWVQRGRPDIVLEQVPKAGTFAANGSQVYLTVSGVEVPQVVGLDLQTASAKLREAGLRQGAVEGSSAGRVVAQEPAAASVVASGETVKLTLRASGLATPVGAISPAVIGLAVNRLPAPTLEAPAAGATFNLYPRRTKLVWHGVTGAVRYGVEVQFKSEDWRPWIEKKDLTATSYGFSFVGKQPGRWRVWAIDAKGVDGLKSDWREFRYLR